MNNDFIKVTTDSDVTTISFRLDTDHEFRELISTNMVYAIELATEILKDIKYYIEIERSMGNMGYFNFIQTYGEYFRMMYEFLTFRNFKGVYYSSSIEINEYEDNAVKKYLMNIDTRDGDFHWGNYLMYLNEFLKNFMADVADKQEHGSFISVKKCLNDFFDNEAIELLESLYDEYDEFFMEIKKLCPEALMDN